MSWDSRARQKCWVVIAFVALSCLPLRLAPVATTAYGSGQTEQHEGPEGKLSEAARLGAGLLRMQRLYEAPAERWLAFHAPRVRALPVRFVPLLLEDPRRRLLLLRKVPPPSDEPA